MGERHRGIPVTVLKHCRILFIVVSSLWLLEVYDTLAMQQKLNLLGIRPRSLDGLQGIIVAPWLHANLNHLMANIPPFIIMGSFVALRGQERLINVTLISWLIGGLGIWLFGQTNTVHIGLSIIIFGYLGYLLANAFFERSLRAFMIAIIVGLFYGGLIFGLLTIRLDLSWQGHLFGLIGGIIVAAFYKPKHK